MIYAIANQKGGESKTTTAAAVATGAAFRGLRSLAIDLDGQCTLSYLMGGDTQRPGSYELITGQARAADVIQHTEQGDVITGKYNLAAADSVLTGKRRTTGLKDALQAVRREYDCIVIDCPPTLSTLLINALAAADGVIIPMREKMVSLQGLYLLDDTIQNTKQKYNKRLKICGVLFTQHSGRTIAARDVADTIRKRAAEMKIPVFNTVIRQGVAVDESQILRKSLFEYAPKSNPARDYMAFLDELGITGSASN